MWRWKVSWANFPPSHQVVCTAVSILPSSTQRWTCKNLVLHDDRLLFFGRAVISRVSDFSIWHKKKQITRRFLNIVPAHCSSFINNRASRHHCNKSEKSFTPPEKRITIDKGLCLIVFVSTRTHFWCDHVLDFFFHSFFVSFCVINKSTDFSISHNVFGAWRERTSRNARRLLEFVSKVNKRFLWRYSIWRKQKKSFLSAF